MPSGVGPGQYPVPPFQGASGAVGGVFHETVGAVSPPSPPVRPGETVRRGKERPEVGEPFRLDAEPVQPLSYRKTATIEQRVARLERLLIVFQVVATIMAMFTLAMIWAFMRITHQF